MRSPQPEPRSSARTSTTSGHSTSRTRSPRGGGVAVAVRVDITDPESVQSLVERTDVEFGGVDILVNNAALMAQIVVNPAMEFSRDE